MSLRLLKRVESRTLGSLRYHVVYKADDGAYMVVKIDSDVAPLGGSRIESMLQIQKPGLDLSYSTLKLVDGRMTEHIHHADGRTSIDDKMVLGGKRGIEVSEKFHDSFKEVIEQDPELKKYFRLAFSDIDIMIHGR